MRHLRVATDVVPVSAFKAQASTWLTQLAQTSQPLVITQNGRPAGVLLSPSTYDTLMERARFVAAIEEGLDEVQHGRVSSHAEVVATFTKRRSRRT